MARFAAVLVLCGSWVAALGQTSRPPDSNARQAVQNRVPASPEMKRLLRAFMGEWEVIETFEVSATKRGQSRQGHATFTAGPGTSLIENYHSNGSAGELRFLGVVWWDAKADAYQFLTCANNSGCSVRGTARWQGNDLVNSWVEEVNGKKAFFKDSFVATSPASFTLISEGVSDGTTVWRVITKYVRSSQESSLHKQ